MKLDLRHRLLQRLQTANYWLIAQAAMAALAVLRRLPADRAMNFADRTARRIGPWFGRHRTALNNLRQAYPEKTETEIEQIASDMWGNMARLAAEYIFLDALFDYDPWGKNPGSGRVEVSGEDIFERIAGQPERPHRRAGRGGRAERASRASSAHTSSLPRRPYSRSLLTNVRRGMLSRRAASLWLPRARRNASAMRSASNCFTRSLNVAEAPGARAPASASGPPVIRSGRSSSVIRSPRATTLRRAPSSPRPGRATPACSPRWRPDASRPRSTRRRSRC